MILRPAWKLMNDHLGVFTEVQCYGVSLDEIRKEENESDSEHEEESQVQRGYESEDEDIEEPTGIKGMTLQLIELLTTLVQRPNV